MQRIGVFGGSFNPPHAGHIRIAESAHGQFALSRVLWIPAYVPPHKTGVRLASAKDRLRMTNLAVSDHADFTVSDLELARGGTSFTIDTLRTIRADNPDAMLFLIIGGDNHVTFDTWKEPGSILELAELIVYPKLDFEGIATHKWTDVHYLDAPLDPVSSTLVRDRIRRGNPVEDLLPASVAEYIETRRLYISD